MTRTYVGIMIAFALAILWWRLRPLTATVTTTETYDTDEYIPGSTSYSEPVKRFALAIANAEGYGIPGAIPTVANNPGDLVLPGWSPTLGSAGVAVFDSPDYGWFRLHRQLALILSGQSNVYHLDMTIAEMGDRYEADPGNAWAQNVSAYLNVPVTTKLWAVLA